MNRFVEECRREWRRLGVADAVADEMAEELATDLAEAESDGASPEDALGSGAFDPRSFAASWATARGVTQSSSGKARPHRNSRILVPVTGVLIVALATGAGLVISGAAQLVLSSHYGKGVVVALQSGAPTGVVRAISVVRGTSAIALQPLGWTLLAVGMLGILLTLAWSWRTGTGPWSRHLRRRGGGGGGAVTAQQHTEIVRFAACMRSRGVPNFPDPSAAGIFNVPVSVNTNAPAFQAATQKCQVNGMPLNISQGSGP